jgi:hypothetical protein
LWANSRGRCKNQGRRHGAQDEKACVRGERTPHQGFDWPSGLEEREKRTSLLFGSLRVCVSYTSQRRGGSLEEKSWGVQFAPKRSCVD